MSGSNFLNFADCATLLITVLPGESVTLTCGSITKHFEPKDAYVVESYLMQYVAYIPGRNFGEWTVSVDDRNPMRSKTLLINEYRQYGMAFLVPDDYISVEYLESSGTQGFKINQYFTPNMTIKTDFLWTSISSTDQDIIGAEGGTNGYAIILNDYSSNSPNRLIVKTSTASTSNAIYQANVKYHAEVISTDSMTSVYINNVLWNSINAVTTSNYQLGVFCRNKSNTLGSFGSCRIYNCQIIQDNNMVCNLFPAKRISDSVLGMYDIVNDVFYTNTGTGTFNTGKKYNDIINPLYIFTAGGGSRIPVTYAKENYATILVTKDNITTNYTGDGAYQIVYFNTEPIDLSKYSRLVVVSSLTTRSTSADYGGIAFVANGIPTAGGTHSASHVIASTALSTGGTNQITTVNLNSITITGYVGVRGGMKGIISNIYLE